MTGLRFIFCLGLLFLLHSAAYLHGRPSVDSLDFVRHSEGLPNGMVHQLCQDRAGYLWIATFYGLYSYDGHEFRPYKSSAATPGLLPDNNVLCLREDADRRLWIGTQDGVCVLDKQRQCIRRFILAGVSRQRVNDICITTDGQIYLGYIRGLAYYDAVGDSLVLLDAANSRGDIPTRINVQTILEDPDGDLLIGTWQQGLYRYNRRTSTFIHYPPLAGGNTVLVLYHDSRGTTWAGCAGGGLQKLIFTAAGEMQVVATFTHDSLRVTSLSSDYILAMVEDRQTQSLWLGTRQGLSIMSYDCPDRFVNYRANDAQHPLPIHEVNSLLLDSVGRMWVGTKGAGIYMTDLRENPFYTPFQDVSAAESGDFVSSLCVDATGGCYVGRNYGVDYYQSGHCLSVVGRERPYHIAYCSAADETLIAIHDRGLYACRAGRVVAHYTAATSPFVPTNLVFTTHEDHSGNLWIGSYKGLGVRYADGRAVSFCKWAGADSLLTKEIIDIAEGIDGSLWLATHGCGVLHLTGRLSCPDSIECRQFSLEQGSLPAGSPITFFCDRQQRLWLGMEGSGLCRFDCRQQRFLSVHQDYALPGDMVAAIAQDSVGALWVATNSGLARLQIESDQLASLCIYTEADGLPDTFFTPRAMSYAGGIFYWGTAQGVVSFRPAEVVSSGMGRSVVGSDLPHPAYAVYASDRVSGRYVGIVWALFSLSLVFIACFYVKKRRQVSSMSVPLESSLPPTSSSFPIEMPAVEMPDADRQFLQEATACVCRHLDDAGFDVSVFVAEMAMSRTSLYNKLMALTGQSTTAFVRGIRMEAARKILDENHNVRISELAYRVGFNDPKYFSSCFKKAFGVQPSEYATRNEDDSTGVAEHHEEHHIK